MTWIRTSGLRLLLALGLSFALWTFVSFSENPDRTSDPFNVPVNVTELSPGLVIVDQDSLPRTEFPTVSVTVEADANTLSRLRPADLRAFIDLGNLGPGEHIVPIEVETVRPVNRRLRFASIEPATITMRLEQQVARNVPVRVEVEGNPPFSFERGNPEITVNGRSIEEVEAVGPQSLVEQVVIAGAVADIDQLSANYSSPLQLQPRDANGQPVPGIELDPATVTVEIPIESVVGLKRVPVIGTVAGVPAPGYVVSDIRSDPPLINLTGSSGPLEAVEQVETEPVDIGGATSTVTREVNLIIPPGTLRQAGEPAQAIVTIQIERLDRSFQVRLPFPVEVTGIEPGLIATPSVSVVTVDLSGNTDVLAQLDPSTLAATIDVSGLGPGMYALVPQIILPETVSNALTVGEIPEVTVTLRLPPQPTQAPTATRAPIPTETVPATPTSDVPSTEEAPADDLTPTAPITGTVPIPQDTSDESPEPVEPTMTP